MWVNVRIINKTFGYELFRNIHSGNIEYERDVFLKNKGNAPNLREIRVRRFESYTL